MDVEHPHHPPSHRTPPRSVQSFCFSRNTRNRDEQDKMRLNWLRMHIACLDVITSLLRVDRRNIQQITHLSMTQWRITPEPRPYARRSAIDSLHGNEQSDSLINCFGYRIDHNRQRDAAKPMLLAVPQPRPNARTIKQNSTCRTHGSHDIGPRVDTSD